MKAKNSRALTLKIEQSLLKTFIDLKEMKMPSISMWTTSRVIG